MADFKCFLDRDLQILILRLAPSEIFILVCMTEIDDFKGPNLIASFAKFYAQNFGS